MRRLLPLLLGTLLPSPLDAQDSLAWPVIQRMARASAVRVHTADGAVIQDAPRLWANGVLVFPGGRSLRFEEIRRVDILRGRGPAFTPHGAVIGALLGGAVGFAATDGRPTGEALSISLAAVGGGALVGGAAGYLLGTLMPEAETIYRAGSPALAAVDAPFEAVRHRRGPPVRLALTPLVGTSSFGERIGKHETGAAHGLSTGQEVGVQASYALSGTITARASVGAIHARHELVLGKQRIFLPGSVWLRRYAAALEVRMRSDVPGYFLVEADGLHNPAGYLIRGSLVLAEDEPPPALPVGPSGEDAGTIPRLGIGLGYDVRLGGDRRLRFEWVYRVGRYDFPEVSRYGFDAERTVRDSSFTVGLSLPLLRPEPSVR